MRLKLSAKHNRKSRASAAISKGSRSFSGFHRPTSNTVYTPNQFFDVCLPDASRGCLRLVGYVIRRVLGWSDAEGNPLEERVAVSYADLVDHAGISRDMIRAALDEAVERGFLLCVRDGQPKSAGRPAVTALYELRWDESGEYTRDPRQFKGFFSGEGNRTYIPNQFFDEILPNETLSVIKVVGSIIRNSIGFQSKHGFRRQHAKLSYNTIRRYGGIHSTSTLASAIQTAIDSNYIVKVEQGLFTSDLHNQIATTYSLKWSDTQPARSIGRKNEVASSAPHRSEKRTSIGQTSEAGNRSVKRSSIEITTINNSSKQQATGQAGPAAAQEIVSLLLDHGLSQKDATVIASRYPEKLIRQQIDWLPFRNPRNSAAMLRQAIKDEWTAPTRPAGLTPDAQLGAVFASAYYAGYAGNDDALTAQASVRETDAARDYLDRILKMWPDTKRVEGHGRRFGAYVREHKPPTADFRTTFTVGLRLFGDEFYKLLNQLRVAEVNEHVAARRAAHQEKYAAAYWAYIASEESLIQQAHPSRYGEFSSKRERMRAFLLRSPHVRSESHRQKQLAHHDSDADRLAAFREHFAADLMDFWTWDRDRNEASFEGSRTL